MVKTRINAGSFVPYIWTRSYEVGVRQLREWHLTRKERETLRKRRENETILAWAKVTAAARITTHEDFIGGVSHGKSRNGEPEAVANAVG